MSRPTCNACLEGRPADCTGWAIGGDVTNSYWCRCSHPSAWRAAANGSAFGEHGHDEREMAS